MPDNRNLNDTIQGIAKGVVAFEIELVIGREMFGSSCERGRRGRIRIVRWRIVDLFDRGL